MGLRAQGRAYRAKRAAEAAQLSGESPTGARWPHSKRRAEAAKGESDRSHCGGWGSAPWAGAEALPP